MEEEQQNSASNEIATPDVQNPESQEEQKPQVSPVDDKQEKNWRAVRQRIAALEKENKDKDELLKQVLLQKQQIPEQAEPEEPDDDYIPKGKVKKLAKKEIEPLKKEIDELKSELALRKQQEHINTLRSRYPDFDDVVNPDTIALLEEKEPELANTIAEMKDPYKIGIQAYKYIKASGLISDIPEKRRAKEVDKKLEKNSKTVQSPQAYDKRPMAQAFHLTESEKTNLYNEMMKYASYSSSVPGL